MLYLKCMWKRFSSTLWALFSHYWLYPLLRSWYIYTVEYYSVIKNNSIMAFADKWMELENIMLSEISQSRNTKGKMFSLRSGWWYIKRVGKWGVREEWRNFRLCRRKWEVGGVWKMVEWDRHHYPMYMYDYTNGMNLHHVQL